MWSLFNAGMFFGPFTAAFIVVLSAFIKVYGVLGAALFLLYSGRLKFIACCILWSIVLFAAPLVCISFDELMAQYREWKETSATITWLVLLMYQ